MLVWRYKYRLADWRLIKIGGSAHEAMKNTVATIVGV